ncbi:HAD family hydrolase [Sphingomonas sp. AX6]|uniref:HAD family hydrolase n=1 Tax=Sphingomonas sp. AX6 TaxID=2653171 RepID=UPI0012F3F67E|nr:HAD-IB family phosphatase [Sphingomonas sp. AX6]VXC75665.1 Phosphoserine phosphatase [Sphingomonas sp. AX6]
MHQLAIYDLDRTITRVPTWTPFLIHNALRRGRWRLALLPFGVVAALLHIAGFYDRGKLKEIMHRIMLGPRLSPQAAKLRARSYADWLVPGKVYAGSIAQIDEDRRAGRRVIIATASYRFYAEEVAERLGITEVVGTEALVDTSGAILPIIKGSNCYGAVKLSMIQDWLKREGIAREAAHIRFYSDHVSDAPTLDWADEPFAVNAHGPLLLLAARHGWPVLNWDGLAPRSPR